MRSLASKALALLQTILYEIEKLTPMRSGAFSHQAAHVDYYESKKRQ